MFSTLKVLASFIWPYVKSVLVSLLTIISKEFFEMVIEIVQEVQESGLDSAAKREKALEMIKEKLEESGKIVKDSILNLILELVVSFVKTKAE